jgi:uncharacterized ferritin-like protein (DUF455 family)
MRRILRRPSDDTDAEWRMTELRAAALEALAIPEPEARCSAVANLAHVFEVDTERHLVAGRSVPGRPTRPRLVAAYRVPRRDAQTVAGRAALLHSIAHIEFNAIGLALDAIWRFRGMPREYYLDWRQVALEEAGHFSMLAGHLDILGHAYGDFDAHDGLWEMAACTAGDVLERMAVVPRRLEARGLDASPQVRAKLVVAGDDAAAKILDVILRDEIEHVAIGNRWFHWLCRQRQLDPGVVDLGVAARYGLAESRGALNLAARRAAGFSEEELRALQRGPAAGAITPPD